MVLIWKKYKIEILLFGFALFVRLFFFVITLARFGEGGFLYYGDSVGYLNLAKNLIFNHVFSQSDAPPFIPDFFRTPIYPIFIAAFYFLFKSVAIVVSVQNIIGALTVVLIYHLGKTVFSHGVGLAAAIFFALEPNIAYWTNELLSETIFTFLLVLCFYLFAKFISEKKWSFLAISAASLSLVILTRPIAIALPFILVTFLIIFLLKETQWKKILISTILFLVVCGAVVAPWSLRNKIVFNSFSLSNQGAVVTCNVNANTYLAFQESRAGRAETDKLRQKIEADILGLPTEDIFIKYQGRFCKRILRILQIDPVGYFRVYSQSFIPFFLGDGYLTMLHKFFPENFRIPPVSLWAQISNQGAVGWDKFIRGYGVSEFVVFLLGKLVWLLVSFFALLPLVFVWRDPYKRNFILMFYLIMIYFATASGFAAYSRFRQPINPILIITAFYGLFSFVKFLKSKFVKLRA